MKGLDYLRDFKLKLHINEEKKWYQRVGDFFVAIVDSIAPLKNEIKVIQGS